MKIKEGLHTSSINTVAPKPWRKKFSFGLREYFYVIRVKFISKGQRVEITVTVWQKREISYSQSHVNVKLKAAMTRVKTEPLSLHATWVIGYG